MSASSSLLKADAKDQLQHLIDSKLRALADLRDIEIAGFGRPLDRAETPKFETWIAEYKARLLAHSQGVCKTLATQADQIVGDAAALIVDQTAGSGTPVRPGR